MAEIVHPLFRSIVRGLKGRCPACGEGKAFRKYLKVHDRCPACGHGLARYPADDGPAYVTVFLTGHLVIAPMLLFPIIWEAPAIYSVPIILSTLAVLMLVGLSVVKGGWIGLMYALNVTDRDQALHTADAAD